MKLSTGIRLLIVLLIFIFCVLGAMIIPACATYLVDFGLLETAAFAKTVLHAVGTVLALPCVAVLLVSLSFASAVEQDRVFAAATARRLQTIAWIFIADCTAFLCGIVLLLCQGERLLAPLLALVCLIGFALGTLLFILAGYIRRAAVLQEEADLTL